MTTPNPIEEKIIPKALQDKAFRQELLDNPKTVVARELGITLPPEASIEVLEDSNSTLHIVLPPFPEPDETRELSDEELEAVAGGKWVIILWTTICYSVTDV